MQTNKSQAIHHHLASFSINTNVKGEPSGNSKVPTMCNIGEGKSRNGLLEETGEKPAQERVKVEKNLLKKYVEIVKIRKRQVQNKDKLKNTVKGKEKRMGINATSVTEFLGSPQQCFLLAVLSQPGEC